LFDVTKWVSGRHDPMVWSWPTVVRRLLVLLGVILLLIAMSLAGSGSVVLA
jgi:hypothetical protein